MKKETREEYSKSRNRAFGNSDYKKKNQRGISKCKFEAMAQKFG